MRSGWDGGGCCAAALAGLALLLSAGEAAAGGVAPHRALYEVGLVRADPAAGIAALSGAALYEWSSGCSRVVVNRETRLSVQPPDGEPVAIRVEFSAWERLDGLEYGFAGRTVRGGLAIEARSGRAKIGAEGGGEVVYSRPAGRRLALEPGTVFPGAWVREVIDHARAGAGLLTRRVFFGEDEDDLLTASVLVLPESEAGEAPERPAALDGLTRWRAQFAFFDEEDEALPAFESTEWFYENGVGGDAVLAFPDFTIRYRLKAVELRDPPAC